MSDTVNLTKSVTAYLTEPATRAGVDALLAVDADSLPPEIEWDELSDYYAARAVAELTRAEFAIALYDLWRAVWSPVVPDGWRLPDPEELVEEGQSVSTGTIWEEEAFSLYHERGDLVLFTLIGIHRRKITVAFSLERKDKPQIKGDLDGFTWRDDNSWEGWMLLTPGVEASSDGTLDLSKLHSAAKAAIAAVEAKPEPTRPAPAKRSAVAKPKPRAPRRKT
jgi:hypothetical protein